MINWFVERFKLTCAQKDLIDLRDFAAIVSEPEVSPL